MKTYREHGGEMDSARVALLVGLCVGLGIVVHEGFFLVAGGIAAGALVTLAVHAIHEHADQTRLAYRPR